MMKAVNFGECIVVISIEAGRWHMSISHNKRNPTWEEIRDARYKFMPAGIFVVMVLPPPENYVNVHEHCFHLWETRDPDAETLWEG